MALTNFYDKFYFDALTFSIDKNFVFVKSLMFFQFDLISL